MLKPQRRLPHMEFPALPDCPVEKTQNRHGFSRCTLNAASYTLPIRSSDITEASSPGMELNAN